MADIRNFAEAQAVLMRYKYTIADGRYTLDRIRSALKYLGDPQEDLKIVHVAGTSGKTSTVHYVASLLEQSGAKVGMTVSPHMFEVNERVQINHTPLPEAEFCTALGQFVSLLEASGEELSYFEVLVAFAFWEFKRRSVDYAVVEVGLGGLLDGTNVVSRADKVCVITDIGFDHTHVLGNTLAAIAGQKAGIIQLHNQVFMYEQPDEVVDVVRARCQAQQAALNLIDSKVPNPAADYDLPLFQKRNFGLAYAATNFVLQRSGRKALSAEQLRQAAAVYIPGRMEKLQVGGKTIILDGAHNQQKMTTFVASLRERYPQEKMAALVAVGQAPDNRWQKALEVVAAAAAAIIVTTFDLGDDDMPKKAVDAETVATYIRSVSPVPVMVEHDAKQATAALLSRSEQLLVVTGSLYLMGTIKTELETRT